MDHIEDTYNFGALLRTCEFFGVKTVIFPKDRQAGFTEGAIRASSGAIYHLNLVRVSNLASSLRSLKKIGYWLVGTSDLAEHSYVSAPPLFPVDLNN